ncbi:MAG: ATP-binding cassette domain-containing protein, partial [Actinomycetes bacterium]
SWGSQISGKAFINGKEANVSNIREAIKSGLAYATEDRKRFGLNLLDDIRRNITIASLDKFVKNGLVDDNKEFTVASEYRESMNIKAPSVLSIVGKLSGGNQQKVVLSQWINVDPEVLILDEPTRGIDVGAKYEIYTIIQRLADEGKGVIVISSELPELLGICDRIYALAEGRITGEVTKDKATPELLMKYMTAEKGTK